MCSECLLERQSSRALTVIIKQLQHRYPDVFDRLMFKLIVLHPKVMGSDVDHIFAKIGGGVSLGFLFLLNS